MRPELVKRLLDLNRTFYASFARDFSETRSSKRMNMAPIMPYVPNRGKLLEVGCGNGRLAERLDREGYQLDYTGVDVTPELIADAKARPISMNARFMIADVSLPSWQDPLVPLAPFDLVLMLAVLHHIPGVASRLTLMRALHDLLSTSGKLVMSNWQFMQNARLRNKIIAWSAVGIDERELEPGDYLLDWKRGGTGYRYVHLLSEGEISELATASGWTVEKQFRADNDLNLYSILRRD